MRIFVINLARANHRRQKMQKQLVSSGLEFAFLEATDGRSLTIEERNLVDNQQRQSVTAYPLSDNEIGCCISHRRAMQELINSGHFMAVVLEDDVNLAPDFSRVIHVIKEQPVDFDFIFLGRKFKEGEFFVPCHTLLPDMHLGRVGYTHMGAIGYIVSQKGARKFLAYAPRIVNAIDKEIHRFWANGLSLYGLERPIIVHADDGKSFLEETRHEAQPKLRIRYAAADTLVWRCRRLATKVSDSVCKRVVFAAMLLAPAIRTSSARINPQQQCPQPLTLSPSTMRLARIVQAWPASLRKCAENLYVLYRVAKDRRIPAYRRLPALLGVGYFFNPIDLIPDSIPVFGYLDDVAMIALGIWISIRLVDQDMILQYRKMAQTLFVTSA